MNMKTLTLSIILIPFILFNVLHSANGSSTLNITVTTDKPVYNLGDNVYIHGNLTLNGTTVSNTLVALQTDDPRGYRFLLRTLTTGNSIANNWTMEILEFFSCDQQGNPKDSFKRGTLAYVNITIRNNANIPKNAVITLNLYYAGMIPFEAFAPYIGPISPGSSSIIVSVAIPSDAPLRNATAYASVFDKWPKNGGIPYCPEKSTTFTITATSSSSTKTSSNVYTTSTEGTYSITFQLPKIGYIGNYTTYVSSYYQGQLATNSTTFEIILIADINGDGKVNILDAILLGGAFGSEPGQPKWDSRCDLNDDLNVNILDAIILGRHFGERAL